MSETVGYVLYEGLPAHAPLADHMAELAELEARPDVDNPGIQAAIWSAKISIEHHRDNGYILQDLLPEDSSLDDLRDEVEQLGDELADLRAGRIKPRHGSVDDMVAAVETAIATVEGRIRVRTGAEAA